MHDHDVSPEAVAELPVRLRRNAARNPRAEQREPITVDDVLGSRIVSPADPQARGGAVVGRRRRRDRRLGGVAGRRGLAGAALTGWGERHDDANFVPFGKDLTRYPWIGAATDEALARAGALARGARRARDLWRLRRTPSS